MSTRLVKIDYVVEGPIDQVIVRRVMEYCGIIPGIAYGLRGKAYLLKKLANYNTAARFAPWLVVVDMDRDADCAAAFVAQTLPMRSVGMCYRVAVREIESWLLADAERLAAYLRVRVGAVPGDPDAVLDPKQLMVNLARQSRRSDLRKDMVPREGSGAPAGPAYTSRLLEFVQASTEGWRVERASEHSESLRRCIAALQALREIEFHDTKSG
jgi:hypothetical protein